MDNKSRSRLIHCSRESIDLRYFGPSMFNWIRCLLFLSCVLSFMVPVNGGLCPPGCQCDNKGLSTVCPTGDLKHIPHFLNPAIKELKVNGNKITKLEGSLTYYQKVSNEYLMCIYKLFTSLIIAIVGI